MKKVAQAEAAQEILGKAFRALEAVNQSPNEDPIQIPPALMTLDQYKQWLSGHHVAGGPRNWIAAVTELAGCGVPVKAGCALVGVARDVLPDRERLSALHAGGRSVPRRSVTSPLPCPSGNGR